MPLVAAGPGWQVQYLNVNLDDICLNFWYVLSRSIILQFLASIASSDTSSGQCKLPRTQQIRPSSSPTSWQIGLPNRPRTKAHDAVRALVGAEKEARLVLIMWRRTYKFNMANEHHHTYAVRPKLSCCWH